MSKTLKIYVGLLLFLFVALAVFEFTAPKPIDWTRTYNEKHSKPYGTLVVRKELKSLMPNAKIQDLRVSPFEFFDDHYDWIDSVYTTSGTYIYIDGNNTVDESSAQELLDFASHGNRIFMSSNSIPQKFRDSLFLNTDYDYNLKGKATLSFANRILDKNEITIPKGLSNRYFSKLDADYTTILGYQEFDSIQHVNFIKVEYGLGEILLHLQPVVFTNHTLLKDKKYVYAAGVISYLQDESIFYDSRNKRGDELGSSELRFILSKPGLRMAWYVALLSLILFIIFNSKRKQRIVKIIKPVENTTVAFAKTIGNLYYETKDHNNLIEKKTTYFLEYVRRIYYIDTQLLDEKFVKNLALKSGKEIKKVQKIINIILYLKSKSICTEDHLLQLNNAIEDFFKA
ncbi:MAG: DUF4350 domain-containing protein [Urechidicola sp.]|nr:DUF4350 domain-containing protein [Urechidicola sp.]